MPYPDLGTMYQNGMGASASFMGGQQASLAREQDLEKLRGMQLENQNAATMNPLNAQFKQGQIAQQGAELPGIQGNSASLVAKGSEDMQLMVPRVAAKLSGLATQIGNDGMVQMGQDGEKLSHAAAIIANYPPHLQKQMFAKAVQQYGGNVSSPMFQSLMQAPDDQFQKAATTLGAGMALAGQKYQQESSIHTATNASHEKIAAGNNETSIKNTETIANARVQAVQKRMDGIMSALTPDKRFTVLNGIPEDELTDNQRTEKNRLVKFVFNAKAAGASGTTAQILSGADVTTAQQNAVKSADEIAPPGKSPQAAPNNPAFAKLAKEQGLPYDESKFKYRVGPNGQLQSAPK